MEWLCSVWLTEAQILRGIEWHPAEEEEEEEVFLHAERTPGDVARDPAAVAQNRLSSMPAYQEVCHCLSGLTGLLSSFKKDLRSTVILFSFAFFLLLSNVLQTGVIFVNRN